MESVYTKVAHLTAQNNYHVWFSDVDPVTLSGVSICNEAKAADVAVCEIPRI